MMGKLRRLTKADEGLMPTEPPGESTRWWSARILAALRAGEKTVTRPTNSRRIAELLAEVEALRAWGAECPNSPLRKIQIVDPERFERGGHRDPVTSASDPSENVTMEPERQTR